jgi:hypothetical protein
MLDEKLDHAFLGPVTYAERIASGNESNVATVHRDQRRETAVRSGNVSYPVEHRRREKGIVTRIEEQGRKSYRRQKVD